jgi:hypothetical protein
MIKAQGPPAHCQLLTAATASSYKAIKLGHMHAITYQTSQARSQSDKEPIGPDNTVSAAVSLPPYGDTTSTGLQVGYKMIF